MKSVSISLPSLPEALSKSATTLLLGSLLTFTAQAEESAEAETVFKVDPPKTENLVNKYKNLARWHMGAVLYYEQDGFLVATNWRQAYEEGNPAVLINEDPSQRYPLPIDSHKFIIDLGEYQLIERFLFRNQDTQGKIQLFYSDVLQSPNSSRWRPASQPIELSESGNINVQLEPLDTRYLMLIMDVTQAGSISSLSAFGNFSVLQSRFAEQETNESARDELDIQSTQFDYATLHTGAVVSHISSGKLVDPEVMIDEDIESGYTFDGTSGEEAVIVDLQDQREVNRISILYDSSPGIMECYFVQGIDFDEASETDPEMAMLQTERGVQPLMLAATPHSLGEMLGLMALGQNEVKYKTIEIPVEFFESKAPDFSHVIEDGDYQFNLTFNETRGRYLIIRWKHSSEANTAPQLKIFEINLFGTIPENQRLLTRVPLFEFSEDAVPTAAPANPVGTDSTTPPIEFIPVDPNLSF